MRVKEVLKDYLTFNRTEQRGIYVLLSLMFLLIVANRVIPNIRGNVDGDMNISLREVKAFVRNMRIADSLDSIARGNRRTAFSKGASFHSKDSLYKLKPFPKETFTIELNSADTLDLQRLRGVGPGFARRIVTYRERLGGFHDKSQLLEIWGFDSAKYNMVVSNVAVNRDSVRMIDLNTIAFKDLLRHPYFPFAIAKAIFLYRKEHKRFASVEELRKIDLISDSTYRKMIMYVKVN
jgi:DNA uptake protein ComE-like DNA-binding protein